MRIYHCFKTRYIFLAPQISTGKLLYITITQRQLDMQIGRKPSNQSLRTTSGSRCQDMLVSILVSIIFACILSQHNITYSSNYITDNISLTSNLLRISIEEGIFLLIYLSSSSIDILSFFVCPITPLLITWSFVISISFHVLRVVTYFFKSTIYYMGCMGRPWQLLHNYIH